MYEGHVAIFTGNGFQIVHAANTHKGVVVKIFSNKDEIFGVKRAVRQTLESFYAKKEAT